MAISALALYTYTIIYIFNYDMEEIFENFIILVIYSPFFRYFWYQLGDYLYWLELNSLIVICNDIKKLKSPYLSFGLYCICTNFEDTLGMILLSPFIFVSLPLYAYLLLGLFIFFWGHESCYGWFYVSFVKGKLRPRKDTFRPFFFW